MTDWLSAFHLRQASLTEEVELPRQTNVRNAPSARRIRWPRDATVGLPPRNKIDGARRRIDERLVIRGLFGTVDHLINAVEVGDRAAATNRKRARPNDVRDITPWVLNRIIRSTRLILRSIWISGAIDEVVQIRSYRAFHQRSILPTA